MSSLGKTYRPELDGIRAMAVLPVIAFHSYVQPATGGWLGVDIFFVLSGYLITGVLLTEHARTGTASLRDFWVRRLLRLYPALLAMLVLGAFFFRTLGDGGTFLGYLRTAAASGFYVEDLIWGLAGNEVGNLGHTWSLAVEMQFYLVWPVVLLLLLRKRQRLVPWIVGGIVVSYALFVLQSSPNVVRFPIAYYVPWTRAFELLLGALVAVVIANRADEPERASADGPPKGRWIGWAIALGFAVLLQTAWTISIYADQRVIIWQSPAAALLTVALLLHLERVRSAGVGSLLSWRPVAWVGKVSYAVYLFHYPVIMVLRNEFDMGTAKLVFLLATAITLTLSALSWHFVEQPALRWKARLTGRPSATAPAPQPID
ncbi:MAG: acyltransferase [Propionibacteriales bacterium]|nr:acyltransferase [Propionibacteriales bacterium]